MGSPLRGWGNLIMTFTGKFVYMAHNFILLWLNLFGLRVVRDGWWFDHSTLECDLNLDMSSTSTENKLCRTSPISLFVQCEICFRLL